MRHRVIIFAAGISLTAGLMPAGLDLPAFAAGDQPLSAPIISCGSGIPGGINCIASKKELKEARSAFTRGLKLEDQQRTEEAFVQFDEAMRLAPQNRQFLTARE